MKSSKTGFSGVWNSWNWFGLNIKTECRFEYISTHLPPVFPFFFRILANRKSLCKIFPPPRRARGLAVARRLASCRYALPAAIAATQNVAKCVAMLYLSVLSHCVGCYVGWGSPVSLHGPGAALSQLLLLSSRCFPNKLGQAGQDFSEGGAAVIRPHPSSL